MAATFGFVYWFQHVSGSGERAVYRLVFHTSVSGLRTGSSVLFNGILVGDVTDLRLDPSDPDQVTALIAIFIAGLALPHAFGKVDFDPQNGDTAVTFAIAYAVVRFIHLGLYAQASRAGNAAWSAIV